MQVFSYYSTVSIFTLSLTIVNIIAAPRAQFPTKEQIDEINKFYVTQEPTSPCECVPFELCENGTENIYGVGLLDDRIQKDDCPNKCCNSPINSTNDRSSTPIGERDCGHRNEKGLRNRISGEDNEALFAEFPWMIGILENENNNLKYTCGGSLIHEQVVLTAAHCVINRDPQKTDIFARAGEWDTGTTIEIYPHQEQKVKKIITHEKYYSGAFHYDIALLILEQPFEYDKNVDIVCLPNTVTDHSNSSNCIVSGWGKSNFEKGDNYSIILKKIDLPMVPNDLCQEKLRTTRLKKFFKLHETFVCAGGIPGHDSCEGDGGSPLICPVEGKPSTYKQVGIVSWGIGCDSDIPGVYTNVPFFKEWIDKNMISHDLKIQYNYVL